MTARKVDAAVVVIERRDPSLGQWVQAAADGLTAGEGEEILCQAFVQDFLWYRLPTKYPERAWLPIARASEVLLRELRLERYASIAGSDLTTARRLSQEHITRIERIPDSASSHQTTYAVAR